MSCNPNLTTSVGPLPDRFKSALQKNVLEPSEWILEPDQFIVLSKPVSFYVGTGLQVLNSILSACAAAEHEVIITTCFWARSPSQEAVARLLLQLSKKALSQQRKISVRICFSSLSLAQKLFHTSKIDGKRYSPASWQNLGLPAPHDLQGLDLIVKSVFIRPCSVMHPKFILVDRRRAFIPSCNVSWENWLEACITLEGDLVAQLFQFWEFFWARATPPLLAWQALPDKCGDIQTHHHTFLANAVFPNSITPIPTILLPSPHHSHPRLGSGSCCSGPSPPPTPLNALLLHFLKHSKSNIYIQTANLTCTPVTESIFDAVSRGVHVHLVTNRRLMLLEQLVTAGTTTAFEVWKLKRRYYSLFQKRSKLSTDPEEVSPALGILKIAYFNQRPGEPSIEEPVMTHLKLAIFDDFTVVLGSGNMDRASWYTSQELGVAFFDEGFARAVTNVVQEALNGRFEYVS